MRYMCKDRPIGQWNRTEKDPHVHGHGFSTKASKQSSGERKVFSTTGTGVNEHPPENNEREHCVTPQQKLTQDGLQT